MNKRVFSIALALILALASMTCVFAESIDNSTFVKPEITGYASSTGVILPATFAVAPVEQPSPAEKVVIDALTKAAADAGSLSAYFGSQAIAAVTSTVIGVDVSKLALDEAFPISVASYDATYGDVTVTMKLAKTYADGDVVVALVGIINADGTITWTPVQATVVNGQVAVTFPQAVLGVNSELVFALLSQGV